MMMTLTMTLTDIVRMARSARCALVAEYDDDAAIVAFTPIARGARGRAATGATLIEALETLVDARVVNDDALRTLDALARSPRVSAVEIALDERLCRARIYEDRVRTRQTARVSVARALDDLARQVVR